MSIFVPSDSIDMKKIMLATVNYDGPIYIRIAKGHEKIITKNLYKNFKVGNIYTFDKRNYKSVIFTSGITFQIALDIQKKN